MDVRDVSKYIDQNPHFRIELNESGAMGYRQILSACNDAASRKNISGWMNIKELMETFISNVVTWGQEAKDDLDIEHIITVMLKHRTKDEGLTALGMEETDYYNFINEHPEHKSFLAKKSLV